jgi:phage gp36-like protein
MAYAAIGDVLSRYKPITTMVGTHANDITSVEISSQFIADAESFVDAYIGSRYTVPLTAPVPALITQVTADLAIFNLAAEKLPRVPDFMQPRYDRALRTLEMLRDGKMTLTGSGVTLITSGNQEAWSPTTGYHPVFSPVLGELEQRADVDYINSEIDTREDDNI